MSIVEFTKEQTEGLNDHVQGQYWIPVKTRKKKGKTAPLKSESTNTCETSGVGSNKDNQKKGKTAPLKDKSTKTCETSGVGSSKNDHD